MNPLILENFRQRRGSRGMHIVSPRGYDFSAWDRVFKAEERMRIEFGDGPVDQVLDLISNYDPDTHAIVMAEVDSMVTVYLFSLSSGLVGL